MNGYSKIIGYTIVAIFLALSSCGEYIKLKRWSEDISGEWRIRQYKSENPGSQVFKDFLLQGELGSINFDCNKPKAKLSTEWIDCNAYYTAPDGEILLIPVQISDRFRDHPAKLGFLFTESRDTIVNDWLLGIYSINLIGDRLQLRFEYELVLPPNGKKVDAYKEIILVRNQ